MVVKYNCCDDDPFFHSRKEFLTLHVSLFAVLLYLIDDLCTAQTFSCKTLDRMKAHFNHHVQSRLIFTFCLTSKHFLAYQTINSIYTEQKFKKTLLCIDNYLGMDQETTIEL